MSLIRQHEVDKVVMVGPDLRLVPGGLCSHVEDRKSLGLVVAVDLASKAGAVTVLWSCVPRGAIDMMELQVQEIKATSRRLKAEWRVVSEDDDILKSAPMRILMGHKEA